MDRLEWCGLVENVIYYYAYYFAVNNDVYTKHPTSHIPMIKVTSPTTNLTITDSNLSCFNRSCPWLSVTKSDNGCFLIAVTTARYREYTPYTSSKYPIIFFI